MGILWEYFGNSLGILGEFQTIHIYLSSTRSWGGYIPGTKFSRGMIVLFVPIGFRWGIFSSNQWGIDIRLIFRLPLGSFIYYVSTCRGVRRCQFLLISEGQIKPKADWRTVDSLKKGPNKFVLFAFLLFFGKQTNSFVQFWG